MGEFRNNSSNIDELAKRYVPFAQTLADGLMYMAEEKKRIRTFKKAC